MRANVLMMVYVLLLAAGINVMAQDVVNVDGIRYILSEGNVLVGRQDKELSGDIVIPQSIDVEGTHYPVTGMVSPTNITAWSDNTVTCEGGAFQDCMITSITLPNSMTVVTAGAFNGCHQLVNVSLPDSLTMLGATSFAGCTSLKELRIPESVKDFGSYTNYGYKSYVFGNCSSLKSVNIPEGVTILAEGCFMGCGLDSISIPKSVKTLSDNSLYIDNLKAVRMAVADVREINYSPVTFKQTSNAVLYVPKGGKNVYSQYEPWSNFNSIIEYGEATGGEITPDQINVTYDNIKYILRDGKATIARQNGDLSGEIVIPETITYDGKDYTVSGFVEPTDITCYSGGSISCKGGAFQGTAITSITLPSTITVITAGAFQGCNKLENVQLPTNLRQLGSACFAGCSKLSSLILPETVTDLASHSAYGYRSYVFGGCTSLKTINIPSGVTQLASGCFLGSGIEEIDIHKNLLKLDEKSLASNSLKTLRLHVQDMKSLSYSNSTFDNVSNADLYVPVGSKQVYKEYYPWMDFNSINEMEDGQETFVPSETTVKIDEVRYILKDGIATIGRQNKDLTGDIVIPEIVEYNGTEFRVTGIVSPTNVTAWSSNTVSTENGAFQECLISSISLPNTISTIPAGMFYGCSNLEEVTLPSNVQELGAASFAGCTSLEEIYLPESINSLGSSTRYGYKSYVFGNCKNLKKVNVPQSVVKFAEGTFKGAGLGTFLITDNINILEEDCFSASNLKKIKITHTNLDNLKYTESCFTNVSNIDLYVPQGKKALYEQFYPWKSFKSISEYTDENDESQYNAYRVSYVYSEETETRATVNQNILHIDFEPSGILLSYITPPEIENMEFLRWSSEIETVPAYDIEIKAIYKTRTVVAESIKLNYEDYELKIGETLQLSAEVLPENADDKAITWSTTNTSIATVSAEGVVTAISVGTATITATCGNVSATCAVTVNPIVATSLTLNKTELSLLIGETETLITTVSPDNTTDKTVTWSSSDATVASVSSSGVVTATKVGTTTITATCGSISATCAVTVNSIVAISLTLNKTELSLLIGSTETLTATVSPDNTTDKTVTWNSSDESVATVSAEGDVTAVKVGTATITAKCGEVSATCIVNVNPILVESIELNNTNYDLQPEETLQLVATVLPENATNKEVIWTSNNEDVVKVDATGLVTFVNFGDAVITATAADGSGIFATCTFSNVDGIISITTDGGNVEMFTLDGKKVQNIGKGVYIINGKKVMK